MIITEEHNYIDLNGTFSYLTGAIFWQFLRLEIVLIQKTFQAVISYLTRTGTQVFNTLLCIFKRSKNVEIECTGKLMKQNTGKISCASQCACVAWPHLNKTSINEIHWSRLRVLMKPRYFEEMIVVYPFIFHFFSLLSAVCHLSPSNSLFIYLFLHFLLLSIYSVLNFSVIHFLLQKRRVQCSSGP